MRAWISEGGRYYVWVIRCVSSNIIRNVTVTVQMLKNIYYILLGSVFQGEFNCGCWVRGILTIFGRRVYQGAGIGVFREMGHPGWSCECGCAPAPLFIPHPN